MQGIKLLFLTLVPLVSLFFNVFPVTCVCVLGPLDSWFFPVRCTQESFALPGGFTLLCSGLLRRWALGLFLSKGNLSIIPSVLPQRSRVKAGLGSLSVRASLVNREQGVRVWG